MPGSVPSTLYALAHLILPLPYEADSIVIYFFTTEKMNFVNVAVSGWARVQTRQPNARALHFTRERCAHAHTYTHSRMHRTFLKEISINGMLSISGGFCGGKFLRARCLRWKQNIYYWTPFVLLVFIIYSFSQITKMLLVHFKKSHGTKNDKTEAVRYHIYDFIIWNIKKYFSCLSVFTPNS